MLFFSVVLSLFSITNVSNLGFKHGSDLHVCLGVDDGALVALVQLGSVGKGGVGARLVIEDNASLSFGFSSMAIIQAECDRSGCTDEISGMLQALIIEEPLTASRLVAPLRPESRL